jgi:hypothetical protein
MKFTTVSLLPLLALALAVAPDAWGTQRGKAPTGFEYVSGGVSHSELVALHADEAKYSFWLTTAALDSGAHLAGVRVRIVDAKTHQTVLEHTMDGPWLFADLPLGRYEIDATYRAAGANADQQRKIVTTIHAGDHHQGVLYFDSPAKVSPDYEKPFKANPYGDKR